MKLKFVSENSLRVFHCFFFILHLGEERKTKHIDNDLNPVWTAEHVRNPTHSGFVHTDTYTHLRFCIVLRPQGNEK